MLREWAYAAVYGSSADRAAALSGWVERYNFRRRHGALGHRPPIQRLAERTGNNVAGIYTRATTDRGEGMEDEVTHTEIVEPVDANPRLTGSREWDAGTYDRVSAPQLEWGKEVIDRLAPAGDETVLDAGCGSGRVTELLAVALPSGRVIGADGSSAMIETARRRLGPGVELIHADLLALELADPVDAVFSSATFHWIPDHRQLFARIASWLRPGGRLEAQCGGAGNLREFFEIVEAVASREPFVETLARLPQTRHFAAAEETAELLSEAGFGDVRCWLAPSRVRPAEPRAFIATVALGAHTAALPESQREGFIDAVHDEWSGDPVMDYVRLNVSARLPPA